MGRAFVVSEHHKLAGSQGTTGQNYFKKMNAATHSTLAHHNCWRCGFGVDYLGATLHRSDFAKRDCALSIAIDIALCLRAVPLSEAWMKRMFPDLQEIKPGENYNKWLLSGKRRPARIVSVVEEALNHYKVFGVATSLDA